jgi:hypothetical protein
MDHRPYPVLVHVQSFVLILVYFSTLPNVPYKEPIIPLVFVTLTGNVIEQNLVGFPNLMYPHVGPYTPYFGFSYKGVECDPIMWPPMSDPLANFMTSPKPVLGIIQTRIVTNHEEPSNEDEDYSEKKHNPKMPIIIRIKRSYHDQKGKPSPIGDVNKLFIGGWDVLISDNGDGPFGGGGNGPLGSGPQGSGGNNLLEDGGCGHPTNQNPRSYIARLARL